jgi:peptidoglycan hydrolase-like protein with peptidoglycan-binding domain
MKGLSVTLSVLLLLCGGSAAAQGWGNLFEKGLDILEGQINSQQENNPAPELPSSQAPGQPASSGQGSAAHEPAAAPVATSAPQPAAPAYRNNLNAQAAGVAEAQTLLNRLGYDVGPADGIYGRKTRDGILAFEADRGLPPSGDVTDALITQLTLAAMSAGGHQAAETGQTAEALLAPQMAIAPDIRRPGPVQMNGQLLSGYPLTYMKRYTQDVFVGRGKQPESSARFNLGLQLDLAVLRTWPQIVDTSKTVFDGQRTTDDYRLAHAYADRFLTGELLFHYLGECGVYGCTSIGNSSFAGWAGGDEFEREASYRAFLAEVVPQLLAMAPDLPLKLLHVVEVQLQSYDKKVGGFPLRDLRKIGESPFADIRFATKLQIESTYRIPRFVNVTQANGSSFLAPLKNRNAYFAADLSVGEPHWDYMLDRPVLEARWSNPRLYADPDLKQLIYEFPDAGGAETLVRSTAPAAGGAPAPATLADAAAPGPAVPTTRPTATAEMARIPPGLLVYRFRPDIFGNERLLKATSDQVTADGSWYENATKIPYKDSPALKNHVFLFSAEQVAGRVPDFAARELLPVYKQRLAEFAERVPSRLTINDKSRLDFYVFEGGTLQMKPPHGMTKDGFYSMSLLSEQEKLDLPPIGPREVRRDMPELWGAMETSDIPQTVGNLRVSRKQYLAFDRHPRIPPLSLDPNVAEQQWRRPDCRMTDIHYLQRGMTPNQAQEAARECKMQYAGHRDHFRIAYHLEIEGVELEERAVIVKAKLLGADVYGTRDELLQHFDAESFPPADNSWARKQEEVAAKEAAKQAEEQAVDAQMLAATRAAEEAVDMRLDDLRQSLSQADIIGIRLGMTISEAERIIRQHMQVGWVTMLDLEQHPLTHSLRLERFPYNEFRAFVSMDGTEQIVLYMSPEAPDRLQAVTRAVPLPRSVSDEAITATLNEKYGEPIAADRYTVWTADFGAVNSNSLPKPDSLADTYRNGTCVVQLNEWGWNTIRKVDGTELTYEEQVKIGQSSAPALSVWGGKLQPNGDVWDAEQWRDCGPIVVSRVIDDGRDAKFLSVGIADLSTYADVYGKRMEQLEAEAGETAMPKL